MGVFWEFCGCSKEWRRSKLCDSFGLSAWRVGRRGSGGPWLAMGILLPEDFLARLFSTKV